MTEQTSYVIASLAYNDNVQPRTGSQFDSIKSQVGPAGGALRLFNIPALKVGTLDRLMEASDDLTKIDPQVEGICMKLLSFLEETTGRARKEVALVRPGDTMADITCDAYVKQFSWYDARYDTKASIRSLLDKLLADATGAEERVRIKLGEYNETRQKLSGAQRKTGGNLSVRPVPGLVSEWCKKRGIDTVYPPSDFMTSVYVAVPTAMQDDFLKEYGSVTDYVVPNASYVIATDADFVLNSVCVFNHIADDFKLNCRKRKWIVRDDHSGDDVSAEEVAKMEQLLQEQRDHLKRLLTMHFSDCFVAWIHLKAIRVYVESLLMYGLPPRFVPVLLAVDSTREKEIRTAFNKMYVADPRMKGDDGVVDIGALQYEYQYVSLKVGNVLHTR